MIGYWSDKRPNGQPITAGTVCFVSDLEDGTHPIYTYGKDKEEVLDKLALQNAHAQVALAKRTIAPNGATSRTAAPNLPPPPARKEISGDQVMQATLDLENPAKAGAAVATLFEHATGIDPQQVILTQYGNVAMEWQSEHPEFWPHPGNKQLLTNQALASAGSLGRITKDHLTQAFQALTQRGILHDEPLNTNLQTRSPLPDESQVQRTERPRGARFATGTRSSSFSTAQIAQPRTLKYTEEQIRKMPTSKSRELIKSGDKDYAEACEVYFGQAKATA